MKFAPMNDSAGKRLTLFRIFQRAWSIFHREVSEKTIMIMICSLCGKKFDARDTRGQEINLKWFPDMEPTCLACCLKELNLEVLLD